MLLHKKSFIVSGASGIIGQSVLKYLSDEKATYSIQTIGREVHKDIRVIAPYIQQILFGDIDNSVFSSNSVYIPLDFVTKEKLIEMNEKTYRRLNTEIIGRQTAVIRKSRPRSVLLISSGAVDYFLKEKTSFDKHLEIYGELKFLQERILKEECDFIGANLIILRLWNCSGVEVRKRDTFALSDFIFKALRNETLHIKAKGPTWRRFVYFPEALKLCLRLCDEERDVTVDSGGDVISILGLANCVIQTLNSGSQIDLPVDYSQERVNNYFSLSDQYESLLFTKLDGMLPKRLEEQVKLTAQLVD